MRREQTIFQVSELAEQLRRLIEISYPEIWIEGELSSLSTPASGHLYFTLKDEKAQLRCAMFKGRASISRYRPQAGDLVRVRAKLSVYTARGDLQCIVQHIEEAGEGILQRRFEELKTKLSGQGLFDAASKLSLPSFPKHIGVITSPSGAAIKDILSTLARRCPGIPVTVYPALVQGDDSAASLIRAIAAAVQHARAEVLILSRGGGSLEDLWSFNHEELAHAIHACPLPIVSGVGHEVDVSIADLVADLRAPTPTAAAELISPDQSTLENQIRSVAQRLRRAHTRSLEQAAQSTDLLSRQLVHPKHQLTRQQQKLNSIAPRISRLVRQQTGFKKSRFQELVLRQRRVLPSHSIDRHLSTLRSLSVDLQKAQQAQLDKLSQKIKQQAGILNSVSPLATLDRGYALARNNQQALIRRAADCNPQDSISVQLAEGSLLCDVVEVNQ